MGLQVIAISSRNSDTSYAGSVLLNSKFFVNNAQADGTGSAFSYGMGSSAKVFDKFKSATALTTIDDIYADDTYTFATIGVHQDVNDTSSSTTNKPIDFGDIVKGVDVGTSNAVLWIENNGKIDKVLINKTIAQVALYSTSGSFTTTTATTTTATTTTA